MQNAYYNQSLIALGAVILCALCAQAAEPPVRDLTQASIEELVNLKVSSVSRKEQRLSHTAAAVFVITQEDIRRSGATSLPEVLRLAPGLSVARFDASKWAVSARGFNSRFANKMLVLIDGRSIYNSLYSGVYWDQNDVPLDDIQRIEVIRGPGATMWGANAVNGVINIITKPARDTQGGLLSLTSGTEDLANGNARYGGTAGDNAAYRVYTTSFRRNSALSDTGESAGDAWHAIRGGARLDWRLSEKDSLSVHGDLHANRALQTFTSDATVYNLEPGLRDHTRASGGYALAKWVRKFSSRSNLELQTYVSQENRREEAGQFAATSADLDLQHRFAAGKRHDLTWGAGLRQVRDSVSNGSFSRFTPARRTSALSGTFVQDDILLVEDKLTLTVGSKFQHAAFSGYDVMPNVRVLWTPSREQSFWGAVSRAVRTPSRVDHDLGLDLRIQAPVPIDVVGRLEGNDEFRAEAANSFEAGYRKQWANRLSLDAAGYFTHYSRLQDLIIGVPQVEFTPLRVIVPLRNGNPASAKTYGLELASNWSASPRWKVSAIYSWLAAEAWGDNGFLGPSASPQSSAANHQARLSSAFDFRRNLSFNSSAQYVSALAFQRVPGYVRLDANMNWRWAPAAELSAGGSNLSKAMHLEFRPSEYIVSRLARRSAWVKLTFRF